MSPDLLLGTSDEPLKNLLKGGKGGKGVKNEDLILFITY